MKRVDFVKKKKKDKTLAVDSRLTFVTLYSEVMTLDDSDDDDPSPRLQGQPSSLREPPTSLPLQKVDFKRREEIAQIEIKNI